jgi:hypothetical protein
LPPERKSRLFGGLRSDDGDRVSRHKLFHAGGCRGGAPVLLDGKVLSPQ